MATGVRYTTPNPFDVDATGTPYAGGQLWFYVTGTSTLQSTYQDAGLTTPNSNPVTADGSGHFGNIFLNTTTAYKVIMQDVNGTQIWAADPVGPAASGNLQSSGGIIGEVRDFAGPASAVPSYWYPCYGQAVSRTTYSSAYSVLGTLWGAGDGSTTFNLPDLRGRATFGQDNMGGSAAGNLTAGVSGVAGNTIGAVGGNQNAQTDTLSSVSTSVVTDPGHLHTLTLPSGVGVAAGAYSSKSGGSTSGNNTATATTGITVATTTTTTSGLTGSSQNIPPCAVVIKMIYLGA